MSYSLHPHLTAPRFREKFRREGEDVLGAGVDAGEEDEDCERVGWIDECGEEGGETVRN